MVGFEKQIGIFVRVSALMIRSLLFFFTLRAKKQKSPSAWYNSGAAGGGAGERLRAAGRATAGGTVKGHGH